MFGGEGNEQTGCEQKMNESVSEQCVNGRCIKVVSTDDKLEVFIDGKKVYEKYF